MHEDERAFSAITAASVKSNIETTPKKHVQQSSAYELVLAGERPAAQCNFHTPCKIRGGLGDTESGATKPDCRT
jgi:hypothetical protein